MLACKPVSYIFILYQANPKHGLHYANPHDLHDVKCVKALQDFILNI